MLWELPETRSLLEKVWPCRPRAGVDAASQKMLWSHGHFWPPLRRSHLEGRSDLCVFPGPPSPPPAVGAVCQGAVGEGHAPPPMMAGQVRPSSDQRVTPSATAEDRAVCWGRLHRY